MIDETIEMLICSYLTELVVKHYFIDFFSLILSCAITNWMHTTHSSCLRLAPDLFCDHQISWCIRILPGRWHSEAWRGYQVVWSRARKDFIQKESAWFGLYVTWLGLVQVQRSNITAIIIQHLQKGRPEPECVIIILYISDFPISS